VTLVNAETGEVVTDMAPDEARDLTDQIKVAVGATWELVKRAYEGRAWTALGYASWDDYCTREFGASRLRLPREERQEVVASLRDSGLSIRAIASATGTGTRQVQEALRPEVCSGTTPATSDPDYPRETPAPQPITGTDGKRYAAPIPKSKPKRSSLNDAAGRSGWEFRKAIERLERIVADDRFPANREQVAAHLRGHLTYAVEVCQDLLDRLDHQPMED
jgi:hypothetical protein